MKRSTKYKMISFAALGIVLVSYNQCITPMGANQKNSLKFSSSSSTVTGGGSTTVNRALSVDAFSQSVYPVTRAHCISCHGASQTPLHASANVNTAYDALMNASKVNFDNPANSRIVLKLRSEQHNCWGSCSANADEMLAAVNKWKTMISGSAGPVVNTSNGKVTVETQTVAEVLSPNGTRDEMLTMMAVSASLKLPFVQAIDGSNSYVWAPLTSGNKDLTSTDAGTATFYITPTTSDFYHVYMYVNAASDASDSLYAKVTGSEYKEWTIGTTAGFEWKQLTNTPQKLDTEFYLTGGKTYQLEVRQKEAGVKVSKVTVTNDPNFNPAAMPGVISKATMTVSLADISGVADSYFDIDIEEFDQFSYKLSNPKIRSPKDLKIKTLKVLVNGSFNPQHSTYLPVDKTITKADTQVSPYSMIVLKDKGNDLDKLSFSFEVIEAK